MRETEPAHGAAALGLVKAVLAQGRGYEASEWLDNFPRCDEIVAAEALRPLAEFLSEVEGADLPVDDDERAALYHPGGPAAGARPLGGRPRRFTGRAAPG